MAKRFEDKLLGKVEAPGSDRNRMNEFAEKNTPTPKTEDENQDPVIKTEYSVIFNNKKHAMVCDDNGCTWSDKKGVNSISLQKNGDVIMLSGSGGNGNACGGRILINAKGGQLAKYDGPIITEASCPAEDSSNGPGSNSSESSTKEKVACSNLYYGDSITECHGEVRIRGTNIVLEAADVLTLIGKSKVLIQAGPSGGGEIQLNAGKITEKADTREEITTGQTMKIVSEDTTLQFDPRASVNTISPGHVNWQILGDYQQNIGGVANITALGKPSVPPLVEERTNSYAIRTVGATGKGISIDSATLVSINSAAAMTIGSIGALNVTSAAATITPASINVLSGTGASITATTGNVDITAIAGNVNVKGLLIYLN